MKITKLNSLTFQRNGVRGECFYAALFNWIDSPAKGENFIATFTVCEKDNKTGNEIDISSCRVVDPSNMAEKWRGDEFAYALQAHLNHLITQANWNVCTFYDLTTNEAEYQKLLKDKVKKFQHTTPQ